MGADESLAHRLAFLGLQAEELRLLAELRPLFEAQADRLVSSFYRHLLSFAETRRLLTDPEVKDRLLAKQRQYLISLAGPSIDEEYVAERVRIGVVHERVGLAPRWYLGAYAHYLSLLAPLVHERLRSDPERAQRTVTALVKLLFLDAQLAMEAYIERREQELEFLNRELAASGRDLAQQVEDGAAELQAAERRARAAEELASGATLSAGLAHESGTPMGVIRGHAELLERDVHEERGRWRLRTIQEQIDRISRIIEALLDLARPHKPAYQPTALDRVLDDTLAFLAEKFRRRGVEVQRQLAPAPLVHGDREKLQQVFLNLLLNAVDAMEGGGTLRVRLGVAKDGRVVASVRDSGCGIAPDVLPRIFDPFYTTKDAGVGNGLGLMVAKSIVGDHGGEIEVASAPGEGSEFRVILPAAGPQSGAESASA